MGSEKAEKRRPVHGHTYFCFKNGFLKSFLGVGPCPAAPAELPPVIETVLLVSGVVRDISRERDSTERQTRGQRQRRRTADEFQILVGRNLIGQGSRVRFIACA